MKRVILMMLSFLFATITFSQDTQTFTYDGEKIIIGQKSSDGLSLLVVDIDDIGCNEFECQQQFYMLDMVSGEIRFRLDHTWYFSTRMSSDGQRFARAYFDGEYGQNADDTIVIVEIRSVMDGSLLQEWQLPSPKLTADVNEVITPTISFSDDLTIVYRQTQLIRDNDYGGDIKELSIWDTQTGELLDERICEEGVLPGFALRRLVSPNGQYAMFGCKDASSTSDVVGHMEVFEIRSGTVLQEIPRFSTNGIVAWDKNSSFIMVQDNDDIKIFDLQGIRNQVSIDSYLGLIDRFTSDSKYFLIDHADGSLHILDLSESAGIGHIDPIQYGGDGLEEYWVSPDGSKVYIAIPAHASQTMRLILFDIASLEIIQEVESEELYQRGIRTIAPYRQWSDDGNYISFCDGFDDETDVVRSIFIWNIAKNELFQHPMLETTASPGFCNMRYSADGQYLAHYRNFYGADATTAQIHVIDLESQEIVFQDDFSTAFASLTIMEWAGDANRLFVAYPERKTIEAIDIF